MKKKHILWVFLLTLLVAILPIYQWLSEAHRLKQIKTIKHEASQINAIRLNDFLGQLKGASPQETLLVLYTGSTQGHLEPCGCFIGQSGGLPRRATAISSIRAQGFSPLLYQINVIRIVFLFCKSTENRHVPAPSFCFRRTIDTFSQPRLQVLRAL